MPGYVMHLAIAQEYLRKNKLEYSEEFIKGTVAPDMIKQKSISHYGESPAYTRLRDFLSKNKIDSDYMKGYFLHLVADYLFYNNYLDRIEKPQIYYDYDYNNKPLIEKYNVRLLDAVRDKVFFKEGTSQIVTLDLACKVIDEVSDLDLEQVEEEVKNNSSKWNYYKGLIKRASTTSKVAYECGVYDILREKNLSNLDRIIQLSAEKGCKLFALGIYSDELCDHLDDIQKPLKSLEDRMKIMEQISGVDFVFPIDSLDEDVIKRQLNEGYKNYCERMRKKRPVLEKKKFEIGYAPGTYDLFHAGHLENLMVAAEQSEKLIVGIKSDQLVYEHKGKWPVISEDERMAIMRHFRFVDEVYKYYTRDLHVADLWIRNKYKKSIGSVFLGSDLKKDFKDVRGITITYTPRDKELMKRRSSSAYGKKLRIAKIGHQEFTGGAEKGRELREKASGKNVQSIEIQGWDRTD